VTVISPDPSQGVLFSCRDQYGGWLTLQVPSANNPGPPDMLGIVVSDRDVSGGAMINLDQVDRVALARTLRVLGRPQRPAETAPRTEIEKMAAFAEELENFGYKGAFLSDEVIRMVLAANSTVDGMKTYIEDAFQNSQKREEQQ
jgi:hypothetical protein